MTNLSLKDAQAEYYKSPVLNSEYYISALEAALIQAEDRVAELEASNRIRQAMLETKDKIIADLEEG